MKSLIKVPDLFTIGNLALGLLAIFSAMDGNLPGAALLILGSMVLDALDGKVALWLNQQNPMGKQLDSLADLVSFGVAPAVIFHQSGAMENQVLQSLVAVFFVSCGMLRLARYNISEGKGFEGVPITVNGVLFPVLALMAVLFPSLYQIWPILLVIQGALMISTIKIARLF